MIAKIANWKGYFIVYAYRRKHPGRAREIYCPVVPKIAIRKYADL